MDLDLTGACNANLTAVPLHPSSFPFYLCHSTLLEVSRFPRPSAPLDNCHNPDPTSQPSSPPPFLGPFGSSDRYGASDVVSPHVVFFSFRDAPVLPHLSAL